MDEKELSAKEKENITVFNWTEIGVPDLSDLTEPEEIGKAPGKKKKPEAPPAVKPVKTKKNRPPKEKKRRPLSVRPERTEEEKDGNTEPLKLKEPEPAATEEPEPVRPEKAELPEQIESKKEELPKLKKERPPKLKKERPPKIKKERPPKLKKKKLPKQKKEGPPKPKKVRIMQGALQTLLCLFLGAVLIAAGYFVFVDLTSKDIDPENIYSQIDKTSFIYDSEGNEIDKLYYSEDRRIISIDEIPEETKDAFIAIEDKTFYEHHGFNFRRMLGAVINRILGRSGEISGTSTITQQLARNVYLADVKSQRTLRRKVSEMIYAWKIERKLSKDRILEAYLNTIYLGYGNYGIDSAARTYFNKDVKDLTLEESAALAALPQAPDSYALLRDEKGDGDKYLKKYDVYANDASKERRDMVLDLMAEQGYISKKEASAAKVDIEDILKPHFEKKTNEYTYFSDYVIGKVAEDLAENYRMTPEEAQRLVYTGGLQIYTTVVPEMQNVINEEFANDYNFPWSAEEPQAAMVITEVGTGDVLAMVGGRGTSGRHLFNRATSPRQPGSSIKPLTVYAAALQKSYDYAEKGEPFPFVDYGFDRQGTSYWGDYITASSYVSDERMYVNGEFWPQNFSRRFTGRQTFRSALQQSINTCAVKIQLQTGADYSMDILKKFGITTAVDDPDEPTNDLNSAALGLGAMTYGVTPLDMAEAYAAFPNGGMRNDPVCYTEVTDDSGTVLLRGASRPVKVLDEGVAYIMTDCLKSVVSRGIARSASLYGVQAGGKTGTTNDTADIWFCGFTPKYSAALWIGTDQNSEMNTTSNTAAYLWSRIMRQVPDVTEGEYREMPDDVIIRGGEYYTEGTEPGAYAARSRNW